MKSLPVVILLVAMLCGAPAAAQRSPSPRGDAGQFGPVSVPAGEIRGRFPWRLRGPASGWWGILSGGAHDPVWRRSGVPGRWPAGWVWPAGWIWSHWISEGTGAAASGFVSDWKERNPPAGGPATAPGGGLLAPGMTEEEVVGRLGSPISRRVHGDGEVWRYSGCVLVLHRGLLRQIR